MSYLYDRQYGHLSHQRFLVKLKNSSSITRRLKLDYTLNVHRGCVNTIWWNDSGTKILSGSDDQNLIVTDAFTQEVLTKIHSGHRENIFSAKFLPETNDRRVVSCSGDGVVFHTNFDRPASSYSTEGRFTCHGSSTAYEVRVIPRTPNLFLSCSDDCTVRLYDLRTKSQCLKQHCRDDVLIKSHRGFTSMDINPMNLNEIVCACADGSIRLYDHRKLSTQISSARQCESSLNGLISCFMLSDRKEPRQSRITSVVFNQHGTEILASYSSDSIYLLDPKQTLSQEKMKEFLVDHRNQKRAQKEAQENKSTSDKEDKTSPAKRLRLRGDWSDTGPDSRPTTEEELERTANPSNPSTETTPERNPQNFFMQRMSDLLTQLVTRTTSEPEEPEIAPTPNNTRTNQSPTITETNETNTGSTPTRTSPIVQTPPSPSRDQGSAAIHPHDDEDDDDDDSHRAGILDLLLGGNEGFQVDDDEGSMDDDNGDDDDDDDDDDENSSTATNNPSVSDHPRAAPIPSKLSRMRKRREAKRSHEENYLKNIPSLGLLNSYDGHRNARTMIKEANFWSDSYVMSGSDCGNIFIWNKFTGNIVRIIQADGHVVNCIQPHPLNYPILASSGIDYNIKIFSPLAEKPIDDSERIQLTVKRNYKMTEETRTTITVPATFIFRMLTSMYRLRHSDDMSGLDEEDDD